MAEHETGTAAGVIRGPGTRHSMECGLKRLRQQRDELSWQISEAEKLLDNGPARAGTELLGDAGRSVTIGGRKA